MRASVETTWNCRQAEAEIALHVGGDQADPVATRLLTAHLTQCPHCREYQRRMTACLELLQACAAETVPSAPAARVWPRVAAKLPRRTPRTALAQFNVWVPTTAMVAACAAMILVTVVQIDRSVSDRSISDRPRDLFVSDPMFASNRDRMANEVSPRQPVPVVFPPVAPPPQQVPVRHEPPGF